MYRLLTITFNRCIHVTEGFDTPVAAQNELERREDSGIAVCGEIEVRTADGWARWEVVIQFGASA